MRLDCGHIVDSCRYHPVQNVKLRDFGWSKVTVLLNENPIAHFTNNGQEVLFELIQDNNYNIILTANKKEIKRDPHLFRVVLDVKTEGDASDFFEYVESMIYDC